MTATLLDPTGAPNRAPDRVRTRSTAVVRHSLSITRRNLVQVRNDPAQLVDAIVMPMVLTLVFVYLLGGAIAHGQHNYLQYLMPGIMVQAAGFGAQPTGLGLNLDFSKGVMDRFRALPIARSAVLTGRVLADTCRILLGQFVLIGFALAIGFRTGADPGRVIAAVVLVLLYGAALTWVSAFVGLSVRNPQTVQSVGFLWMMPVQFASSLFVPTATLPGWLRAFAQVNPVTHVINATRSLLTPDAAVPDLPIALAWLAGLIAVFAPLAVWQYRRRT